MKPSALALALLLCCFSAPALAAPGDLDSSFGRHGLVHTNLGGIDYAEALGLQPDGRIVVGGDADLAPPSDGRLGPGKLDMAIARYTAKGRLDRGFASRGFATLALGGEDTLTALDVQPYLATLGGQSRVRDSAHYLSYGMFALARFGSLGPDPGFGEDGWVTIPETAGSWSTVALIHRGQYGETVAIGPIDPLQTAQDHHRKLGFVHLYPDGTPDLNFAPGGTKLVPFEGNIADPRSFLLDSRGGVLVAGHGPQDFNGVSPVVVRRFSLDGVPDPGFGTNGVARIGSTHSTTGPMALQRDGSILVSFGGDSWDKARIVRLSPTGVLDKTFAKDGILDTGQISSLAVDRQGRIVVSSPSFHLVRYEADGTRDRTFKGAKLPKAWAGGVRTAIAIDRGGDVVAAGWMTPEPNHSDDFAPTKYDFGVARFHGGDDAKPPKIAVAGGGKRCLRGDLRVRVRDETTLRRVVVVIDGRAVARTSRSRLRVRLSAGRHRVAIKARDSSDNVAVERLRVTRCR